MRYPAVPLVTVDPYFSCWSTYDSLYAGVTTHWTGKQQAITGIFTLDGKTYRFMGKINPDEFAPYAEPPTLRQTSCMVHPTRTIYRFQIPETANQWEVVFWTPLLLNDLRVMARPTSYIDFTFIPADDQPHDFSVYVDIGGEMCINQPDQEVKMEIEEGENCTGLTASNVVQDILNRAGDDVRIDWGRLHLLVPKGWQGKLSDMSARIGIPLHRNMECPIKASEHPVLAVTYEAVQQQGMWHSFLILGYEDVASVRYFGKPLSYYGAKAAQPFEHVMQEALIEHDELLTRCEAEDDHIEAQTRRAGGVMYQEMCSLGYRQAIAAHKLVQDEQGRLLFFSKECFSNGCMATVDVTYPSIPLFLCYCPELVKGMLRPIMDYAVCEAWPYEFAPHDVGRYPIADGQAYGMSLDMQMPVEECGNMLICIAAVVKAEERVDFARPYMTLLESWVQYLIRYGLDPENQLCTDDFAGHLSHNVNLAVKAIVGIACYGQLCGLLGDHAEAERYQKIAQDYAASWVQRSLRDDHTLLVFNDEAGWSLKYNLVWDQLLSLGLFPDNLKEMEVDYYLAKKRKYGTPMDSRCNYTKADWLLWAGCLTEDDDKFQQMIQPLYDYLEHTPSRVPFSDWYHVGNGRQMGFQNRSVIGGIFMKLLKAKWTNVEAHDNALS